MGNSRRRRETVDLRSTAAGHEEQFEAGACKLLDFMAAHPELADQLALFMADAATLESADPDAAEILWREMAEFAGGK